MTRRVLVLGYGKRVREAALPALAACEGLELAGVAARSAREEDGVSIQALSEVRSLADIDLVYIAVGKDATPQVLAKLVELDPSQTDLLIETPVVRFKHFRHVKALQSFRSVSVAEDCAFLPWFDTVQGAVQKGLIGAPKAVLFRQSAYAYHGLASARALLDATSVRSGRRKKLGPRWYQRDVHFAGGKKAHVLEPRDYGAGQITLLGTRGSISDYAQSVDDDHELEVLEQDGLVTGFRIEHVTTELPPDESALTAGGSGSVTNRQEAMKRVGFLRIWKALASGGAGYPIADGIDDMVVDYHLEKLGRYVANPITSSRSRIARTFLSLVTRAGG